MAAAISGGSQMATSEPWRYINDNLIMNAQMLEAFYFENIKRVIYIGSATLYQEFDGYIKENDLDLNKDPCSAYFGFGWVVRLIEKLCEFWHAKHGMEIVIARVSNIFGPYTKFSPQISNFISALIRKAVDRMDPFEVWGEPDVTRDVLYSEDFGRAIALMMDKNDIKFDIFNIGSGTKTTVNDAVNWVLKYTDYKNSKIKYTKDKPATFKFRALDCSKAEKILHWKPEFSVEEGIKKTVEWWIKNKEWWKK
jgi:GDP-L-fucose synthase